LAKKRDFPELAANATLALAFLYLHAQAPQAAKSSAEAALAFYETHGQKESQWLGLFCLARAERALGHGQDSKQTAAKALDILATLQHNWVASTSQIYERRPDVSAAKRELLRIARS
jgi:hypothetical protein